jgi:hypothetical protein
MVTLLLTVVLDRQAPRAQMHLQYGPCAQLRISFFAEDLATINTPVAWTKAFIRKRLVLQEPPKDIMDVFFHNQIEMPSEH